MAAYRQAKRMQRGVKLGYQQRNDNDLSTQFISSPIAIGVNDFSIEFFGNTFGSSSYVYNTLCNKANTNVNKLGFIGCWSKSNLNGIDYIQFTLAESGDTFEDAVSVNWTADSLEEKFLLTITRQGTTVKVYINGELKATKEQSEVKDLGDLQLAIANSSDVGFVRVWNMCLSADDVTDHYNNGDPMGYVVPKLYRQFGPNIEPAAEIYEFNIGSPYSQTVIESRQYPFDCIYRMDYIVDEWDFQPKTFNVVGFLGLSGAEIISGTVQWYSASTAKIGELQSCLIKMSGTGSPKLSIYGDQDNEEATARHLKVTINSITPVGLLAEYLPQNMMAPRKYKFPLDSFTQSANTFSCSASTTNKVYDNPQANGFSGEFMRFEAITDITLTCSYYIDVVQRAYPIRVTAEYRSNADLIGGFSSGPVVMSKNEGEASIVSFDIPNGISNSEYIRCADNPEAWLEMRILSIEPISNMATSWLDSAKQLPLSDEYMEPLFQSIGGYDMTANGAPEILYNE